MSRTLDLALELVRRPSTTPLDAGCQELLIPRLEAIGFTAERLPFRDVTNFWARRGTAAPLLVFAGHTDVVPPGSLTEWDSPPFEPEVREGMLYGRGAADMKGSLAAMVTACEAFVEARPDHRGSVGFLVTSDEEGPAVNGTAKVIEVLEQRGEHIDWCLVGEPSSEERLGDVAKNGRRGSLNAHITIMGVQGHVAYPQRADNPVHRLSPVLAELIATRWDNGNAYFPATTFQVAGIHAGTGADNVIPGSLELQVNWRFSPEISVDHIRARVTECFDRHDLRYTVRWISSGEPFLTRPGELTEAVQAAVREVTGIDCRLATSGGTSDGRFIAPTGAQVVELGPLNASIHKINECVSAQDLDRLSTIYQRLLERLLAA